MIAKPVELGDVNSCCLMMRCYKCFMVLRLCSVIGDERNATVEHIIIVLACD